MIIEPVSLTVAGGALALAGGIGGTSIGIGVAASRGAYTLANERRQLRNVIVLASLPMTNTFYALIVFLLIITTVVPRLPADSVLGFAVLAIGAMAGIVEFFSAWYLGVACAKAIAVLPMTRGKIFGRAILLAAMASLAAVLGMVFAIMAMALLNLM
jgi:V/A-type H+/Na+-transporting ATPase subunit K